MLSGEDDVLGGGIYWRENEKESKNTCINAPAIVGALRIYQHTQDPKYLQTAERLYAWTVSHLQDAETGLFFDNVALDGTVDQRKFSYNSALMIRANCLLHQVTGENKYLEAAQRIARAAEEHWVDAETGAMRDAACFAHMLLEAFLAVNARDGDSHWIDVCTKCVTHLHNELRDEQGRYPGRWDQPREERRRRGQRLIDQASAARLLCRCGSLVTQFTPSPHREPHAMKLFVGVCTFAFLASMNSIAAAQAASKPNIVVILCDDLGYGDIHAFNPERGKIATPNIDRLAKQGMMFTDAHAPSSVCTPTRYSVLTGRYSWRSRLQSGVLGGMAEPLIAPGRQTIASFLQEHGYATACIGKWHLGLTLGPQKFTSPIVDGRCNMGSITSSALPHRSTWNPSPGSKMTVSRSTRR